MLITTQLVESYITELYDLFFSIIYHINIAKKTIVYKIIQNLVINKF